MPLAAARFIQTILRELMINLADHTHTHTHTLAGSRAGTCQVRCQPNDELVNAPSLLESTVYKDLLLFTAP